AADAAKCAARLSAGVRLTQMRFLRLIIVGCGLVGISCGLQRGIRPEVMSEFRGHYEHRFEVDSFRPCGLNERWRVKHKTDALVRAVTHPDGTIGGELYVELRGVVTDRGHYGHLGAYDREL